MSRSQPRERDTVLVFCFPVSQCIAIGYIDTPTAAYPRCQTLLRYYFSNCEPTRVQTEEDILTRLDLSRAPLCAIGAIILQSSARPRTCYNARCKGPPKICVRVVCVLCVRSSSSCYCNAHHHPTPRVGRAHNTANTALLLRTYSSYWNVLEPRGFAVLAGWAAPAAAFEIFSTIRERRRRDLFFRRSIFRVLNFFLKLKLSSTYQGPTNVGRNSESRRIDP
jgi:hypothetical protein